MPEQRQLLELLAVACGGAIGAGARYLVTWQFAPGGGFPWPTLLVNVAGCFLMGLLMGTGFAGQRGTWRAFCCTGVLGGFTTMSAFSAETVGLFQDQQRFLACGYVLASLLGCLLALWLGITLAQLLPVWSWSTDVDNAE